LNEILVIGGANDQKSSIAECERFSLVKRASRQAQSLQQERASCEVVFATTNVGENRLFAIGGSDINGEMLKTIESIDTSLGDNGKWERYDVQLPTGLKNLEAVFHKGKIYILGG